MESTPILNSPLADDDSLPSEWLGDRLIGSRYWISGPLEEDRGGAGFLAADLIGGQRVTIHLFRRDAMSSDSQRHLEHDAAILRMLQTPSLECVLNVGEDDNWFFVVCPCLPGITLRQRLSTSPLVAAEAVTLGRCLFSALQATHGYGVLHRDIRPANIIVGSELPLTNAILTNFCLEADEAVSPTRCESVEEALYHSPERAGVLNRDISAVSDLYSAGVVLFESLAGHVPFLADNIGDALLRHMTSPVPELRRLGVAVPRTLDEVIQRLLQKDPRDRYQEAAAVLKDLDSIDSSLSSGVPEPSFVIGTHDRRQSLTEPAFVGRLQELAKIDEQIQAVLVGNVGFVCVEAESGGGRTRLLAEIASRAGKAGMRVLHGQGSEQVGQKPFHVLDGIIDDLVALSEADPMFADSLCTSMGEHTRVLGAALPRLCRSLGWRIPDEIEPDAFAVGPRLQALSALFDALGSTIPAMIILDDFQWADEWTIRLLAHWRHARGESLAGGPRVLVVAAIRSEDAAASSLLMPAQPTSPSVAKTPTNPAETAAKAESLAASESTIAKLGPTLELRLAPLSAAEVHAMLESMAGPLPSEAIEIVTQLSDGSPFMASAVLRGTVESGALVPQPDGWRIESLALADLRSSSQAAGLLSRRIDLLPKDAISLLTVGAVIGREFELAAAARLAGLLPSESLSMLEQASHRHIVWIRPDTNEAVFVHNKIRDACLNRLTSDQRSRLHHRIAEDLLATAPNRVFDLAHHFNAAGEADLALPYAVTAAEQARSRHLLDVAEQQYRIAMRGIASAEQSSQYRIHEGLGDILMLRGRYQEAEHAFRAAAEAAEGELARAQVQGKLGELDFKRGDMARRNRATMEPGGVGLR